jgi:hypothetical protein
VKTEIEGAAAPRPNKVRGGCLRQPKNRFAIFAEPRPAFISDYKKTKVKLPWFLILF